MLLLRLCYAALFYVALDHVAVTLLAVVGIAVNFAGNPKPSTSNLLQLADRCAGWKLQMAYQLALCIAFTAARTNNLPSALQAFL